MVQGNKNRTLKSSFIKLFIFLNLFWGSLGHYFDCDPVNDGHYCLCAHGETGVWDVQCPAKILEVYPITLKLALSPMYPDEASLRIICDPSKSRFQWRLIQGLDFDSQNITFTITSLEISYCPVISTTDLQNFFHQIKLDPENIQSFAYLTLKGNTSFPPDFLKLMPNLEIVDLRNNGLETLPSFQGLEYLNQLNLRGNNISYILPDTFSLNPNLEQIRLGGNSLSNLEKPIFPDSLILLDLVDNQITTIANESLANLQDLQILFLNNNPLERVESGAFSQLKNLTELSLDYSRLFSFPVLKNLPKLTNLSISYSLFTSTKLVTTTTNDIMDAMMESDTQNTNFYSSTNSATDKDDLIDLPTRTRSNGKFSDYENDNNGSGRSLEGVFNKEDDERRIMYGRSDENNMSGGNTNEEIIGDLFALKKLILINDDLKSLSWLGFLPNLTDLVLSKNEIRLIPEGFFRNLPSVKHVDMSKNSISELSEMNAPLLTFLDLSNNFIRFLDKHYFPYLKQLKVLSLSSNKIEYVHPKAFENLHELVILDLSNNRISFEQGPPIMSRSMELEYDIDMMSTTMIIPTTMEMDEDKITETIHHSPLQYCKKLEKVILRNNLITRIFMDWTFIPTNLKSLDLSRNKIKSLHPRDLYFISQDVRFDLRYNEISDVDMDFAELLLEPLENKNIVVLLDGNPINCDCHAISFKKFNVKSYKLYYSDLRCASPPSLNGRKFIEVPAKDLRCIISQSCPTGCSCWELPSENLIKMDCNSLKFSKGREEKSVLKSFIEVHEPLEFEMDFSGRKLRNINNTFIKDLSSQVRLVNLTKTGLSSISFLDGIDNNITKFALSKNPFKCDGCDFQKMWWKHYKRIADIKEITCITAKTEGSNSSKLISFYDLVKNSACAEEAISDEIRFLIISLGVIFPLIIALLICCSKQKREKELRKTKKKKTSEVSVVVQQRPYVGTRSKVVDMDNSKF